MGVQIKFIKKMAQIHDLWVFVRTIYPHDRMLHRLMDGAIVENHSILTEPDAKDWRELYQSASIRASVAKMDEDKAAALSAENEAECFAHFYKKTKEKAEES